MPLLPEKKIKMDQQQNMELTKDQIIQELIALLNQNQQRKRQTMCLKWQP